MNKIKDFLEKHKKIEKLIYLLTTLITITLLWSIAKVSHIDYFLNQIEAKTYDFRMRMPLNRPKPNKDIIILAIDDDSIDVLGEKYGRWPWDRMAYVDGINYLEKTGVRAIAFDLMFIGNQLGNGNVDKKLAETINGNSNVYVSMNFDNRENLNPPKMPDRLKMNVINQSKNIDFEDLTFSNCRVILKEILNTSNNIGIINFLRDEDGISRRAPIFIKYQGDYYPYLAYKLASKVLDLKEQKITSNNELLLNNKKIKLDNQGMMLLNWYGYNEAFTTIPYWKLIKSQEAVKKGLPPMLPTDTFKNKIVFVGVSATSLYDIKSTPLSKVYPGVEVQATALNNLLDKNTVREANRATNLLICLALMLITSAIAYKFKSTVMTSISTITLMVAYLFVATLLLKYYYLWVGVTYPIIVITLTFTTMYIIKYINKSRDFEYTYKLATTDGLTNLYNHRYFQEHLASSIDNSKRYGTNFSLILIDIDFFKKFNDTYGHQAGDAVLKQVAGVLKRNVRTTDLVARYGGEEMAIILANTDNDDALLAAQKVCNSISENPFKLRDDLEVNVSISLGVATYPQNGLTPQELIEYSDKGLYYAKEHGRNQVGQVPVGKTEKSDAV